jgi:hypothetical protein
MDQSFVTRKLLWLFLVISLSCCVGATAAENMTLDNIKQTLGGNEYYET